MIKIFVSDEVDVCKNHFEKLYEFCQNKIEFLEILFEFFETRKNFSSLVSFNKIKTNTKKAIIKIFLKDKNKSFSLKKNNLRIKIDQKYLSNSKNLLDFFNYLKEKPLLEKILKTNLSKLEQLEYDIFTNLKGQTKDDLNEVIKLIFSYSYFTSDSNTIYNDYELAKLLDINVCPYCNRLYTNTVINSGSQIIRPTFDHFYDKDTHPLFSISFYNLIPSCSICNTSLKGKIFFSFSTHLDPYEEGFGEQAKFYIEKINDIYWDKLSTIQKENLHEKINSIQINIKNKNDYIKITHNIIDFKLKEIYQASHIDIVKDLAYKFRNYTYDTLFTNKAIKTLGLSNKKSLYEFYTSNLYDEKDFQNRPLSKFTKDIFDDLLSKGYAKEFQKFFMIKNQK